MGYILHVKKNQDMLHDRIKETFDELTASPIRGVPYSFHKDVDAGHVWCCSGGDLVRYTPTHDRSSEMWYASRWSVCALARPWETRRR